MRRFYDLLPSWETFLIYIGGIPTLISAAVVAFMILVTAKNKAYSLSEHKNLRKLNKTMIKKEKHLKAKIASAPKGVKLFYKFWIGETNYHDLTSEG